MNHSFLFLAEGFEEIEALTVVDVMRRAGMDIKTVSITTEKKVLGAHGIAVDADFTIDAAKIEDIEWLIAPGGMPGSTNLATCEQLNSLLKSHAEAGGKVAAICAAPAVVLAPLGILNGKEATCYPDFDLKPGGAKLKDAPVVVSDNVITANGPASAMAFALAIVANSMGEHIAKQVGEGMLLYQKCTNIYL